MYSHRTTEVFTTYGVVDPRIEKFVFVGQTADFEQRKGADLRPEPGRKAQDAPCGAITSWTQSALAGGWAPVFVALDIVDTQSASLNSESDWVSRLVSADHPLLNSCELPRKVRVTKSVDRPDRPLILPEELYRENRGSCWTSVCDEELFVQFSRGGGANDIASATGRTRAGIRARLVRLGLIEQRKDLKD